MKVNDTYENFVMRSVRQQRTARTLHEAYRDGEYGYSIHLFKDDASLAWEFFKEAFVWMCISLIGASVVIGFLSWLGVL
jgi:hypothetical protein